ncbi:hypothetical protein R3P38DRAFT_3450785 [Favolaschia claudopus]|uniref:Clr5 domain-containing protein n=1 Tax=Favolaschia claudopus TaxID=2862362 RepID=A0AAV9ZMK0_9AGAR
MAPRHNHTNLSYWKMRKNDKEIVELLRTKHLHNTEYGIGLTRFREMRKELGLTRARQQNHTVESIRDAMLRLRLQYPKAGHREISSLLFHEENMSVPRSVITSYFAQYEPELVRQRRANRLRRKRFWAAGTNTTNGNTSMAFALHTGVEPFIGRLQWLKIWWTNSNPRLILSYYLDVVLEGGFMPLISQSDPGNENLGVANGHTLLRHLHDSALIGTLQHRWMNEKKNIPPEISWSQLRRRFTPGFEDILDVGVNNGWYDPNILSKRSWMHTAIESIIPRRGLTEQSSATRGAESYVRIPGNYGVLDFKVKVDPEAVAHVRNLYAPPDHDVFQLVPEGFAILATEFYAEINSPPITRSNVWEVYMEILLRFEHLDIFIVSRKTLTTRDDHEDDMALLPNLTPLESDPDNYYMGGVNNGRGPG